jgi:phosphatidylglycerophosphate synthase
MTKALVPSERQARRDASATVAAGLVVSTATAVGLSRAYPTSPTTVALSAAAGSLPVIVSSVLVLRRRPLMSTLADRVTLARTVLVSSCAAIAVLIVAGTVPARTWWFLSVALVTLLLDAVDGQVARRTGSSHEAGARLDMESDAVYLVVLCFALAPAVGWWILIIGAMRYLLMAATWLRPELREPLPRSRFRVVVAGLQGSALVVAIAPIVPVWLATVCLLVALGLLLVSFGSEIIVKERRVRHTR